MTAGRPVAMRRTRGRSSALQARGAFPALARRASPPTALYAAPTPGTRVPPRTRARTTRAVAVVDCSQSGTRDRSHTMLRVRDVALHPPLTPHLAQPEVEHS